MRDCDCGTRPAPRRGVVRAASHLKHFIDEGTGTMDSALIVFRREPVEIRLVKDRSQWSVDLIADGWPEQDQIVFPLFHGFALE